MMPHNEEGFRME